MKNYLALAAIALLAQAGSAQDAVIPAEPLIPLDQWFHPDDYPPASMRGAEEGDVSALLTIDPHGIVAGCASPMEAATRCWIAPPARSPFGVVASSPQRTCTGSPSPELCHQRRQMEDQRDRGTIGRPADHGGSPPEPTPAVDMPAWLTNEPTRARNRLTYHLGGIMSAPMNLDIDLDSGRYAFESQPHPARPDLRSSRSGIL